ncbi:hypothetical protein [Marinovum sp.]|uniref:hypothetical protein n=1 Tax=Marinovum sp. TaxID=2024839 RepID=UPI002B267E92|nr:hypothetical protein [Marinovum sp.]
MNVLKVMPNSLQAKDDRQRIDEVVHVLSHHGGVPAVAVEKLVKTVRRKPRQTYSAEEKIRHVLTGPAWRGKPNLHLSSRRPSAC